MRKIVSIVVILIIAGIIFVMYPRTGTFNKLVLDKYKDKELAWISVKDSSEEKLTTLKNTEEMDKIITYISSISLKENDSFKESSVMTDYITFQYTDTSFNIMILDKNHIKVISETPGRHSNRIYKITKNEIEIEKILKLFR